MLSIQRKTTGVLLTWCFIGVAVLYCMYVICKSVFIVDGGYSEWSEFTACSATCGGGARSRTRTCTNPIPNYFGKNCSQLGVAIETMECGTKPCPIKGGFSDWGPFGPCSTSCGDGIQFRERKCDNPSPQYGGADCKDIAKEDKKCYMKPCPVNGGYSDWGAWSSCSVTCGGGGERTRSRKCDKPEPQHGGSSCVKQGLGEDKATEKCTAKPCPVITTENTVKNSNTTQ